MSTPQSTSKAFGLPPYMEGRLLKSGKISYRVLMPSGKKINLGMNYAEAMDLYGQLLAPADDDGLRQLSKNLYDRHRKGAVQRKINFELTPEYIAALLTQQKLRCAVTGRLFEMTKLPGVRIKPWAPSIDRIQATQGYVEGNCRIVCASINVAISDLGDANFMALLEPMIRRIVREELAALK